MTHEQASLNRGTPLNTLNSLFRGRIQFLFRVFRGLPCKGAKTVRKHCCVHTMLFTNADKLAVNLQYFSGADCRRIRGVTSPPPPPGPSRVAVPPRTEYGAEHCEGTLLFSLFDERERERTVSVTVLSSDCAAAL